MDSDYLIMAQTGFLVLTFICFILVLGGIRKTLQRMGWMPEKVNKRLLVIGLVFLGWQALVSLLALKGILSDFSTLPPKFTLVTLPPLLIILTITFNSKFSNFLLQVPVNWLIYLQTFRLPVEIFLWWLVLAKAIPEQMSFEGRNLDVLTGITAPIVAWLCFGRNRNNKALALIWNLCGLGLLINIVATAILSLPTSFRVFLNNPDSSLVTTFPIVFLPTVLVPLAYSLHFFSLRKLWLESKS